MHRIRVYLIIFVLIGIIGCNDTVVIVNFDTETTGTLSFAVNYNPEMLKKYGFLSRTETEGLPLLHNDLANLIHSVYSGLRVVANEEYVIRDGSYARKFVIAFDSIASLNIFLNDFGFKLLHEVKNGERNYAISRTLPEEQVEFHSSELNKSSIEQPYAEDNSYVLRMMSLLYADSVVRIIIQAGSTAENDNSESTPVSAFRTEKSLSQLDNENFSWAVRLQ